MNNNHIKESKKMQNLMQLIKQRTQPKNLLNKYNAKKTMA